MIIIIIVIYLFLFIILLLYYYCCLLAIIHKSPFEVEAQQLKPHELKAYEKRIESVTQIPAL